MIFLTRHGQTEFNVERRLQGRRDSPLTPLGERQAARMGRVLKEAVGDPARVRVIASPLGRTVRTAEIVRESLGLDCAIETDARLAEVGLGDWEGLVWPEIEARHPGVLPGRNWLFDAPGGETLAAVAGRLNEWLGEIDPTDGRVRVVISHGGAGRVLRHLYVGAPLETFDFETVAAPHEAVFRLHAGVCGRIDEHLEPLP